jgi:hypothetical protein
MDGLHLHRSRAVPCRPHSEIASNPANTCPLRTGHGLTELRHKLDLAGQRLEAWKEVRDESSGGAKQLLKTMSISQA